MVVKKGICSKLIQQYSYRELFFDTNLQMMLNKAFNFLWIQTKSTTYIIYMADGRKLPLYYYAQWIQEEPYSSGVCGSLTSTVAYNICSKKSVHILFYGALCVTHSSSRNNLVAKIPPPANCRREGWQRPEEGSEFAIICKWQASDFCTRKDRTILHRNHSR